MLSLAHLEHTKLSHSEPKQSQSREVTQKSCKLEAQEVSSKRTGKSPGNRGEVLRCAAGQPREVHLLEDEDEISTSSASPSTHADDQFIWQTTKMRLISRVPPNLWSVWAIRKDQRRKSCHTTKCNAGYYGIKPSIFWDFIR